MSQYQLHAVSWSIQAFIIVIKRRTIDIKCGNVCSFTVAPSHALATLCTKRQKNLCTRLCTKRNQQRNRQTDGQTDKQTDRKWWQDALRYPSMFLVVVTPQGVFTRATSFSVQCNTTRRAVSHALETTDDIWIWS